jgi:hypothetical protein
MPRSSSQLCVRSLRNVDILKTWLWSWFAIGSSQAATARRFVNVYYSNLILSRSTMHNDSLRTWREL